MVQLTLNAGADEAQISEVFRVMRRAGASVKRRGRRVWLVGRESEVATACENAMLLLLGLGQAPTLVAAEA